MSARATYPTALRRAYALLQPTLVRAGIDTLEAAIAHPLYAPLVRNQARSLERGRDRRDTPGQRRLF